MLAGQRWSCQMDVERKLVCLNMIVKNEANVIRRCLDSLKYMIDYWVIVDTGSTDGTQDVIRQHMHDIPGELHEQPWQDFAHNRSQALMLARGKCDYTLIIDADDSLEVANRSAFSGLAADQYMLRINDTGIVYSRPQLVRSDLPWRYEGVLHEYLTCDTAEPAIELSGVEIRLNQDGARRKNPLTYQHDAAVLEAAIAIETSPFLLTRYQFYLAQSYRDSGRQALALQHYAKRAEMGFWIEEVFMSLYCMAQLKEQLHYPDDEVVAAYLRAAEVLPTRVEPLHRASHFCRQKGRFDEGYRIAKQGLTVPMPTDALFVEPTVYDHGLWDEFSLNAYWSGRTQEFLDACLKMLAGAALAPDEVRRIAANAQFASAELATGINHAVPDQGDFVAQHGRVPCWPVRPPMSHPPAVLIAVQVNELTASLATYLECIELLDYPRSAIHVLVRDDTHDDAGGRLLREWANGLPGGYGGVAFESDDRHDEPAGGRLAAPEPSPRRSVARSWEFVHDHAVRHGCKFILVAESDCFLHRTALCRLVSLNLPIVAPFLRSLDENDFYSNYHADIDSNGYFQDSKQYGWIARRLIRGVIQVPVVKGAYLVRTDGSKGLSYVDHTKRDAYVVFADHARNESVEQYIDNREVYGYTARSVDAGARSSHDVAAILRKIRVSDDDGRWFHETVDANSVPELPAVAHGKVERIFAE